MQQEKITGANDVVDATRNPGASEVLKPIELVLCIPRTTYKVLQWAAKLDRARDLKDWIVLSAWQRAVRMPDEHEAFWGLVQMYSGLANSPGAKSLSEARAHLQSQRGNMTNTDLG